MGWLKIQKLNYLENGTELFHEMQKFLTHASYDTYCFLAEVTFALENVYHYLVFMEPVSVNFKSD